MRPLYHGKVPACEASPVRIERVVVLDFVCHWTAEASTPGEACAEILEAVASHELGGGYWRVGEPVPIPSFAGYGAMEKHRLYLAPARDTREPRRRVQVEISVYADSVDEAVRLAYADLANPDLGPRCLDVVYGSVGFETARIRTFCADLSDEEVRQRPVAA